MTGHGGVSLKWTAAPQVMRQITPIWDQVGYMGEGVGIEIARTAKIGNRRN